MPCSIVQAAWSAVAADLWHLHVCKALYQINLQMRCGCVNAIWNAGSCTVLFMLAWYWFSTLLLAMLVQVDAVCSGQANKLRYICLELTKHSSTPYTA